MNLFLLILFASFYSCVTLFAFHRCERRIHLSSFYLLHSSNHTNFVPSFMISIFIFTRDGQKVQSLLFTYFLPFLLLYSLIYLFFPFILIYFHAWRTQESNHSYLPIFFNLHLTSWVPLIFEITNCTNRPEILCPSPPPH